jgi:threonine/homoserine/homoserine lactone efflux protein
VQLHVGKATDAATPTFHERLWPSLPVIAFALLMTLSLGVAFGHAYGAATGIVVAVTASVAVVAAMTATAPVVKVDSEGLQAGVAVLPWSAIGSVRQLDAAATKAARGPRANAAAYFLLRGWLPDSVIVTVVDPDDPHPYWHLSTRRPAELAQALVRH